MGEVMENEGHKIRSDEEAKTYELFHEALRSDKWNSRRVGIARAFKAMHTAAMPASQIHKVACAICSIYYDEESFSKELTKLAREKVLRSYVKQGKRLYEVNY